MTASSGRPGNAAEAGAAVPLKFDVVVLGATPGGIAATVAAARLGRLVALVEYHRHIGGMAASGLGKSDIENRAAIAGFFREFTGRILTHYTDLYGPDSENAALCRDGYRSEPSVAETVFSGMLANCGENVVLLCGLRLLAVHVEEGAVTAIEAADRGTAEVRRLEGGVFIDATYEGTCTPRRERSSASAGSPATSTGSRMPGSFTSTISPAGSCREPPAPGTRPFLPTPTASA